MVLFVPSTLNGISEYAVTSMYRYLSVFSGIEQFMLEEETEASLLAKSAGIRRIWLVRHGLTAWNMQQRFCGQSDIPLAPEGRAQARWLARCLRTQKIAALFTSDLRRACETAEIIAETYPQTISFQTRAAWREIDFGLWEGLTYTEIVERFPTQLDFFSRSEQSVPPGGESLAHLRSRVLEELRWMFHEGTTSVDGDILIVSHGGPLRVLLSSVLGMPVEREWQLALDPGSLSALDLWSVDLSAPSGTLALLNLHRSIYLETPMTGEKSE
jgi:broad specificity phosphatase PhoE